MSGYAAGHDDAPIGIEMEDYELRTSHAASYMRGQMGEFAPSEKEFREIFRIKAEYDTHFGGKYAAHDGPVEEKNPAIRPEIEQRVRQVLGGQRYQEYQRTLDPNYRALSQIAARYTRRPASRTAPTPSTRVTVTLKHQSAL